MNFINELIVAGMLSISPAQLDCLAKNVYFEARNQSKAGMVAVSHVVLNRVESARYPNNICDVVTQAKKRNGKLIRHKCQFSWYCDGLSDYPLDKKSWKRSVEVARDSLVLYNSGFDATDGAMYYHTKAVSPHWSKVFERVSVIDDHIFYRGNYD